MVGPSVTKQRWFHEDYDYKQVLYIVLKRCLISSLNNPGFQTLNVLLDKIMQNGGL